MEPTAITKNIIELQKTVFNNTFNTMVLFQQQTETRMNKVIDQMPWATEEGKKVMQDANEIAKKVRDDFKKVIDDSYTKLEEVAAS